MTQAFLCENTFCEDGIVDATECEFFFVKSFVGLDFKKKKKKKEMNFHQNNS